MLCIGYGDLYMLSSKLCSPSKQCLLHHPSLLLKGGIVVSELSFDAQGNDDACCEFNWATRRLL